MSSAPLEQQRTQKTSNTEKLYEVGKADLPVHCPMEGTTLWNSHPRVYLPLEPTGEARCPYCGAIYRLRDS